MQQLLLIILAAALVNNFVLVNFLGLCPLMGVSRSTSGTTGMALATGFVLALSSATSYLVEHYVLAPAQLEYLRTVAFILIIAGLVQLTELVVRRWMPVLHRILGIYLPLITSNCAVLGVALLNARQADSFAASLAYGLGAAAGFGLVLILFGELRERINRAPAPAAMKGAPLALLTAGLMSLAFMGFAGLVRS